MKTSEFNENPPAGSLGVMQRCCWERWNAGASVQAGKVRGLQRSWSGEGITTPFHLYIGTCWNFHSCVVFPPLSFFLSSELEFEHLVELTARLLCFKRWKVKKVAKLWSTLLALDHILACNLWTQGPAKEEKSYSKYLQVGCGSIFTYSCSQIYMLVSIV